MSVINGGLGPSQGAEVPLQEVSAGVHSTVSRSGSPAAAETIEGDRELYERVVQRIRTTGETIRIEEVLGDLDDSSAGQSGD